MIPAGNLSSVSQRSDPLHSPPFNVEQKMRKEQTEGVAFLSLFSSVRRWKFDVRCSMFAFFFGSVPRWKFGV